MRRDYLVGAILVIITLAVFSPALNGDFVHWDDNLNITYNPKIQKLDASHMHWMLTDSSHMRRYVPLSWLNWAALYQLFGLKPLAFHAEALLFHGINTILVFWLLRKLLKLALPNERREEAFTFSASIGALLWAVHPLRVEVTAWANCVIYAQSLLFALLALFFYFRALEIKMRSHGGSEILLPLPARHEWGEGRGEGSNETSSPLPSPPSDGREGEALAQMTKPAAEIEGGPKRTLYFWAAVFLFALSLLTYPTVAALAVVLVVLDFYPLRRLPADISRWRKAEFRSVWWEKIPFVAVAAIVLAVNLWARANMGGVWQGTSQLTEFGWMARAAQAFYIWAYYLWKPWWPFDLSPVYTQLVSFKPTEWPFLLSALIVIGGTGLFIFQKRRRPALLALWVCHLVLLVPMLGLTEHPHYPNDRYNYVAGILWSMLVAIGLLKIWPRVNLRITALTGAGLVVAALSITSFRQTQIWQNSGILFQTVITRLGDDPYRCDTWWRLGGFHASEKRFKDAAHCYTEALKIKSDFISAHQDLGSILVQQNKLDEAIVHFREVLRASPKHPLAHYNLGVALDRQGKFDEAAKCYSALISIQPTNADAHLRLAVDLNQLGRIDEAIEHILTAVRLNPTSPDANFNAGNAMMGQQKVTEALGYFSKAVELKPDHAEAHYNLGTVLAMTGKVDQALPHFATAAKCKPDFAEAHMACGMAMAELGKAEEARQKYRDALRLANLLGRQDLAAQIESRMK